MAAMVAAAFSIVASASAGMQHVVGGPLGWSLNTDLKAWPQDRDFHVGDKLLFEYNPAFHSVLLFNLPDFEQCNVNNTQHPPLFKDKSGHTVFPLQKAGSYHFTCGEVAHCKAGMKLSINVLNTTSSQAGSHQAVPPKPDHVTARAPHVWGGPAVAPPSSRTPTRARAPQAIPPASSARARAPHKAPASSPTGARSPHVAPASSHTPTRARAPHATPPASAIRARARAPHKAPAPSPTRARSDLHGPPASSSSTGARTPHRSPANSTTRAPAPHMAPANSSSTRARVPHAAPAPSLTRAPHVVSASSHSRASALHASPAPPSRTQTRAPQHLAPASSPSRAHHGPGGLLPYASYPCGPGFLSFTSSSSPCTSHATFFY
ncbi:hypothetical protein L7F22_056658 [Adiantum nelumboides]|nr:hypothetical protein [Adiantum nelumboides]